MSAGQLLKQANHLKRAGNLDEAIALYHQAIAINPDFAWTYYELADALVKSNQIQEAIVHYRHAVDLKPEQALFKKTLNQCSDLVAIPTESCETRENRKLNIEHNDENRPMFVSYSCCQRYLSLLKSCLLDDIYGSEVSVSSNRKERAGKKATASEVENGRYWPSRAHTMIGRKRLDNIQYCVEKVIENKIDGDLIETGVWRGGATIFMKAILEIFNVKDKIVYVADSFEGLPEPDAEKYPVDNGDEHFKVDFLKVSLDEVKENFLKYNLLDDQVRFIKGFFEESLKKVEIEKISVLRLDGDIYSSTIQVLNYLYDRVAVGGYIIVDDYGLKGCRTAVDDFRKKRNITENMIKIDWTGVYWQKTSL
ncbi:tetratricopeptide repeat protein [Microcoleus sp. LEGE 07076]|nr:tetratricopeptide repeat protein [Microcoleus sp. LEGE 07076]